MAALAASLVLNAAWGTGAQAETAPFVFEGAGALRIDTPRWVSDRDYVVAAPAYVDVAPGVQAHMRGNITAAPGSWNGLYKLGEGSLRLSGAVSYPGSTRVLQGGLHIDGSQVFGVWGSIEAAAGAWLQYSPGTDVSRALTLRSDDVSQWVPADLYSPAMPPAGLEDAMGWRVDSGTAMHSGLLQGTLPFVKLGSGVLDITGDAMAYFGQARVREGTLAINEIFSGSVEVGPGARLQGTGSAGAVRVLRGGTLAPGNGAEAGGMGAMTVAGDLFFEPGSRFEVMAAPTGEASHVWVGGRAVLDGEVAVLAQDGLWKADTSYRILGAHDGFDNTEFVSVSSDLAFLAPSLEYHDNTVTLILKRNETPIEDVGETPDEEEVGRVIDEDGGDGKGGNDWADEADESGGAGQVGGADPPGAEEREPPAITQPPEAPGIHDQIVGLDRDNARQALRQLTGSWNASVLSSIWEDSRFMREAVLHQAQVGLRFPPGSGAWPAVAGHMAAGHGMSSGGKWAVESESVKRMADTGLQRAFVWAEAFHSDGHRDGALGVPGDTRRLNGLMLGVAAAVNAYWKAGAFFGAQNSRLARDGGAAAADVATTHAGLHVAGHMAGLRLALGAARSWHRIKGNRTLQAGPLRDAVSARYSGHTAQVFGEAAWPLFGDGLRLDTQTAGLPTNAVQRLNITPFLQMAWVKTSLNAFVENGGPAALNVRPASMAGWVSTLGLWAEAAVAASFAGSEAASGAGIREARIHAQLAWHHAGAGAATSTQSFRDSTTQTVFTSQGLAPERLSWSLRLGLDTSIGRHGSAGFAYLGRYAPGLRDQGIGGWARIAF